MAFVAAPANAATRINCVANGFVDVSGSGPYSWSVLGSGICLDTLQGNFLVGFSGAGSSTTLGLCGGLVVQNLSITVNMVVTNLRTLVATPATQTWSAPLTTFPLATPFLIDQGGALQGVGLLSTRILLNCPPAGNHVATFVFTTTGG
ncbi:MAG: hypothetical protein ACRDJ1_13150 [Actinomycetota bacterium]